MSFAWPTFQVAVERLSLVKLKALGIETFVLIFSMCFILIFS